MTGSLPSRRERFVPSLECLERRDLPSSIGVATLPRLDAPPYAASAVKQVPAITSPNQATFTIGLFGSFTVTATGNPSPTLSEKGSLPAGLSFQPSTGVLSGTPGPATAGTYKIKLTALNSAGSYSQQFSVTVNTAPVINSVNATTFVAGTFNYFVITAIGSPLPTLSETGALPAGVEFTSTGVLEGKPTEAGVFNITIRATNGIGNDAVQYFTLTVVSSMSGASSSSSPTYSRTAGQKVDQRRSLFRGDTLDSLFSQGSGEWAGVCVGAK